MLAQADVSVKTNEIPMLPIVLDKLDLTNVVITADALHTQRETAGWIRGRFIFPVNGNQPNLFAVLDALPGSQAPPRTTIDEGRGRHERRTHPGWPDTSATTGRWSPCPG